MNIIELNLVYKHVSATVSAIKAAKDEALIDAYVGAGKIVKLLEDAHKKLGDELKGRVRGKGGTLIAGNHEVTLTQVAATPPTVITLDMVGTSYGGRKESERLNVKQVMG